MIALRRTRGVLPTAAPAGRRLWLVACLSLAALSVSAAAPPPAAVQAVDSITINVSDLEQSVAFYQDVLGFTPVAGHEVAGEAYEHLYGVFGLRVRSARLRLGDEAIELTQFLAPRGRPMPADSRSNDRWFQHIALIVSDIDRAYTRLRQFKVEQASTGPQRLPDWNPNAGGIKAYYFRDPDGNFLEILEFPPGKGAAKWQRRDGTLFLGIDHTAIVVADTESSLAYYRDQLGLRVAGSSENYGTEQEHLNNVFGARLRITALRAAQGPGIELLEYLAPQGGRPMPADTQANDHWYWQINMRSNTARELEAAARRAHAPIVSGGLVTLPDASLGFEQAMILRDPDGHASLIADQR
jgi:catechol 2,3-dioxygenase-like lactoylglutathione lyase family enzyme